MEGSIRLGGSRSSRWVLCLGLGLGGDGTEAAERMDEDLRGLLMLFSVLAWRDGVMNRELHPTLQDHLMSQEGNLPALEGGSERVSME